jgi:hypothetical protein
LIVTILYLPCVTWTTFIGCLGVWKSSIWPANKSTQCSPSWYTFSAAHSGWHGHLSAPEPSASCKFFFNFISLWNA